MTDLEFVKKCIDGDVYAWEEFVSRYSRLIRAYVCQVLRTRGLSTHDEQVDDVVQDILLGLIKDDHRKLRSYQGRNGWSLASWLRQVAVHATIDRSRAVRMNISLDDDNFGIVCDIILDFIILLKTL